MFKGFLQYLSCCHFAGIPKKYESLQRFYGNKKMIYFSKEDSSISDVRD